MSNDKCFYVPQVIQHMISFSENKTTSVKLILISNFLYPLLPMESIQASACCLLSIPVTLLATTSGLIEKILRITSFMTPRDDDHFVSNKGGVPLEPVWQCVIRWTTFDFPIFATSLFVFLSDTWFVWQDV